MSLNRFLSVVLLMVSLLPLMAVAGAKEPVTIVGGGVVSPSGKVVFLPAEEGGVEAVALFNGKRLWHFKDRGAPLRKRSKAGIYLDGIQRPLLAALGRVFVEVPLLDRPDQLKIVAVDAVTGQKGLETKAIRLPDWVSIAPSYEHRYVGMAMLQGRSIRYVWKAIRFRSRPVPLLPGEIDSYLRRGAGEFRVDAQSGKVTKRNSAPEGIVKGLSWRHDNPGTGVVGLWSFEIEDKSSGYQTRRFLKAAHRDGKMAWKREINRPIDLPPRP